MTGNRQTGITPGRRVRANRGDRHAASLAAAFLKDGDSGPMMEGALGWGEMNAMMPQD